MHRDGSRPVQAVVAVAGALSSIISIVGALRNRHDKMLRAMTLGLVGVASVGLTVYFVVSLTRGWLVHARSVLQEQATRAFKQQHEKSTAALMADISRKDQRIAQLEAQLMGVRRTASADSSIEAPGHPKTSLAELTTIGVMNRQSCPGQSAPDPWSP
jgi:hypothetical protein